MRRVDALLNALAPAPSVQALADELDLDSFADLLLLQELGFADDALLTRAYVHKPTAQRLRAGPVSDGDGSLGNGVRGASGAGWRHCAQYAPLGPSPALSMRNWFARLSALPAFGSTLLARWAMHRSSPAGALSNESVDALLGALFAQLNYTGVGAGHRNSQRWPLWEKVGARRTTALPFREECAFVRRWTQDRLRWIDTVRYSPIRRSSFGSGVLMCCVRCSQHIQNFVDRVGQCSYSTTYTALPTAPPSANAAPTAARARGVNSTFAPAHTGMDWAASFESNLPIVVVDTQNTTILDALKARTHGCARVHAHTRRIASCPSWPLAAGGARKGSSVHWADVAIRLQLGADMFMYAVLAGHASLANVPAMRRVEIGLRGSSSLVRRSTFAYRSGP